MSKNITKVTRGNAPKSPKDKPAVSTLKQYMTQGASPRSTESGRQGQNKTEKKKGSDKKSGDTPEHSREDLSTEGDQDVSGIEGEPTGTYTLTKGEMSELLRKMENSIKTDIQNLRGDLGHILERVEHTEKTTEEQKQEIETLRQQVKETQKNQRMILYKLEDQENRSRRKNIRIRSAPEKEGEDLKKLINTIFWPLIDREGEDCLKIERIHRVGYARNVRTERPRDIIVRFRFYEDKWEIWKKLRGKPPIMVEGAEIQIYADLAQETLARRRLLKPLLEIMKAQNIKYTWGFPAWERRGGGGNTRCKEKGKKNTYRGNNSN